MVVVPPRFSVPVVPCTKLPVPARAEVAVIVPLLVRTEGLVIVNSVPTVKVPLLV